MSELKTLVVCMMVTALLGVFLYSLNSYSVVVCDSTENITQAMPTNMTIEQYETWVQNYGTNCQDALPWWLWGVVFAPILIAIGSYYIPFK